MVASAGGSGNKFNPGAVQQFAVCLDGRSNEERATFVFEKQSVGKLTSPKNVNRQISYHQLVKFHGDL